MKIIKTILIIFMVIFFILIFVAAYGQYWAWHRTLTYDDKLNIECKYHDFDCSNEGWYYQVIKVNNSKYNYLLNKYVEIICKDEIPFCDSINNNTYNGKIIELSGNLYKDKAYIGIYDCYIDAYRFNTIGIKIQDN